MGDAPAGKPAGRDGGRDERDGRGQHPGRQGERGVPGDVESEDDRHRGGHKERAEDGKVRGERTQIRRQSGQARLLVPP